MNSSSLIIGDELDSSPSLNPDLLDSLLLLIASYMLDMKHLPLTIRQHTNNNRKSRSQIIQKLRKRSAYLLMKHVLTIQQSRCFTLYKLT